MPFADSLDALLRSYDLLEYRESILRSSKPSIRMKLIDPREDEQATRFGGQPVLNEATEWPCGRNGEPLGFLAQINLAELPINPYELPSTGLLSFFYDTEHQPWGFYEDAGSWVIRFTDLNLPHRLTANPSHSNQPELRDFGVQFIEELTIPAPRSIELDRLAIEDESDKWKAYFIMRDEFISINDEDAAHRLFGHPDAIQGCMQRTIQFESRCEKLPDGVHSYYEHPRASELIPGAFDWKLILQFDSFDGMDLMWGDGGKLFFWMHTAAIKSRDWDKAWMKLQCY